MGALFATSGVIYSRPMLCGLSSRSDGGLIKESLKSITDMGTRERVIFAPLVVMTLLLGVYPALALDVISPAVENLVSNYNAAFALTRA
jgi:NADH:ubiquinone oxidoreductase subunit 4 (chain M)